MALNQVGFVGRIGPVFVDDTTVAGKKLVLLGMMQSDDTMKLIAKSPAFWGNVRGYNASSSADFFNIADADISLGTYQDNQLYGVCPAYKVPSGGSGFDGYKAISNAANNWVTAVNYADLQLYANGAVVKTYTTANTIANAGSGGSGSGGSGSGGSGSGGSGSGSGSGTGTSTITPTASAPTLGEQIQTFLSQYWYVVVIVLLVLFWPKIGPALGLSKRKPKRR